MNPKSYLRTEQALSKLKVFVIIFLHTLSTEREYRLGILSITHDVFHAILLRPYTENEVHGKFPTTITRTIGRGRSLRSRDNHQTSTTRPRIPILYQMERLSHHRSNMGKQISVF